MATATELEMLRVYFMGVRGMGDGYHVAFDISRLLPARKDGARTMFIPHLCRSVRVDPTALRKAPKIPWNQRRVRRMILERARDCRRFQIDWNHRHTLIVLAAIGGRANDRVLAAPMADRTYLAVQERKEQALITKARTFAKYKVRTLPRVAPAAVHGQLSLAF